MTGRAAAPAVEPESAVTGLDVRALPWLRPLAGDYAYNFSNTAAFYAGDPASPAAWRDAIARARQHQRPRQTVAEILTSQLTRRGAPDPARAAAADLARPDSVAVVTGQQAGAFGGPLFTLLKAVGTIQLARRASAEFGVPVIPIFWVDAEDHDWNEIRSCTVLDGEFQPRTVTLEAPDGAGERPVAALTLDARVEQSLTELAGALAPTDFTDALLASVRASYRPGAGMAAAFARFIEQTLGPYGLVVFESADPACKPLVAELFAREVRSGRTAVLATEAGQALAARGHDPQVVPQPGSLALFHLDGARRAMRHDGDRVVIGDSARTPDSVAEEVLAHPDRFSPNVLLRPLVQDTLFPTACYVAGPSELAYLAQLRDVYAEFGIPMPLVHPRATATLLDSAAARFLSRYDVSIEDLQPQDEAALNRLLKSQLPREVDESLRDADAAVHAAMARVVDALPSLDPTLAGAAKTTLGKMEHDLRQLQGKVIQAAKRRDDTLRRQFARAQALVCPLGEPQERALSFVYFLNRYGPALVDRLLSDLPLELGKHWLITI